MGTAQRNAMLFPGGDYWQRVVRTAPANLISYWPLWDASGTSVVNLASLRGMPAAVGIPAAESSNVTLAQPGIGDGKTSMLFVPTSSSYVNIYSAELASAFNGAEGTLMAWVKVANAAVWADGSLDQIFVVETDTGDSVFVYKDNAVAGRVFLAYKAGGTTEATSFTGLGGNIGWICFALTWSKAADRVYGYCNGIASTPSATLGVWGGAVVASKVLLGTIDATLLTRLWSGSIAHVALWNTPLSAAQIAYLSRVR